MSEFNQQQYKNQYNKKNYENISIRIKKEKKEKIINLAKEKNISVAKLITTLVEKEIGE